MDIPELFVGITTSFAPYLTNASYLRLLELFTARVIAIGPSTITNLSRVCGKDPYRSPLHHVLSRYKFNLWPLCFALIALVIKMFCKDNASIVLSVDDTTCLHKGPKVFGRAKHRDGVRSSHAVMIPLMGHKWVVISIVLRLPGSTRDWALPICVGLCQRAQETAEPKEKNSRKKKHKTPSHIARLLIGRILRRFPKKTFIIVGDQGYGQHESAKFFPKNKAILVSKFHKNAALHEKAKIRTGAGRSQIRGKRLPTPEKSVAGCTKRTHATVSWYGGKKRMVSLVSGIGYWYRQGKGVALIKWVHVKDLDGTHRDEYLFTTDISMSDAQVVSYYTSRWATEVTFQECKAHLKIEKSRVWCKNSVLRLAPFIFGAYTLIVIAYFTLDKKQRYSFPWPSKNTLTFTDMMVTLRRHTWSNINILKPLGNEGALKNSEQIEEYLLNILCQAA